MKNFNEIISRNILYALNDLNMDLEELSKISNIEYFKLKSLLCNDFNYNIEIIKNISKALDRNILNLREYDTDLKIDIFKSEKDRLEYEQWLTDKRREIENSTIDFSNLYKKRNFKK